MNGNEIRRVVRSWPAWVVLVIQVITIIVSVTPSIDNFTRFVFMMVGPAACVLLFVLWLLLGSRLGLLERFIHLGIACSLYVLVYLFVHPTMGVAMWIYGVPLTMAAITIGLILSRSWQMPFRVGVVTVLLLAMWFPFVLVRLEGFKGNYLPEFAWRWAPRNEPPIEDLSDPGSWKVVESEWPRFRGPGGDGRVTGFETELNWKMTQPSVRWRVPIGPGWSSFASVSGRLFTQEQRGDKELVTCYDADTGSLVWQSVHDDRFSDVVSGAGPRATPTFVAGRLYTFSAKAVLKCLDAESGDLIWQRDLMKEVGAALPVWGFSGSPLVIEEVVIVYAGGKGDNGLVAYKAESGKPVWQVASGGMNFSSPQRVVFSGQELVLFGNSNGLMALEPTTGKRVWGYQPEAWRGPAICQPQQIDDTSLIVPLGDGKGLARLEVKRQEEAWKIKELWSNSKLKPSFNDFVHFKGHCYGFDQHIFCCIDAETGDRAWKAGRYGFGQVILLTPVGQMIVTTESGEAVLLAADPREHRELGRVQLLDGKTWNHPIVVDGQLFMRNGKEAVCLELVGSK